MGAEVKEGLVDHPLPGKPVQRRQGRHRHQPHQHRQRDERHFFADAAQLLDIAMAGAIPHRARAEEQRGFKQAVVHQVIEPAGKAQRHQQRALQRDAAHPCPQAEQDNADVLQGVVRQQALDVVLHQGIESADKGGDHAHHQQQHPEPQRRQRPAKRDGQHAVEAHLHHHRGEERRGRRAGVCMRLGCPAVQRDHPRQQAKARQTRQPDAGSRRLVRGHRPHYRKVQGAVVAPRLPAGEGQQQRPQTSQHKPELAGLGAAGKKRAAQGHDLRHHHQPAEVINHDRGDGGGHQQVGQQAVTFGLRVAMPGDSKQADEQRRQADGDKPHRPDAAHLDVDVKPGDLPRL